MVVSQRPSLEKCSVRLLVIPAALTIVGIATVSKCHIFFDFNLQIFIFSGGALLVARRRGRARALRQGRARWIGSGGRVLDDNVQVPRQCAGRTPSLCQATRAAGRIYATVTEASTRWLLRLSNFLVDSL